METKEQILKRAYEAHFSSQKYEKSNFGHTYKAVSESAMDEWAKQQAIAYSNWKDKLSPAQKCTVWPPAGSGGSTGLYTMTDDDLYEKFLQSIQQP